MKKIGALLLCLIFIFVLLYGGMSFQVSKEALTIWFEKLVPSMFCVMVLVRILFDQGILHGLGRILGFVFGPMFRIDATAFSYVIACIFLGFPAGACFINSQVMQGNLSVKQGQRLICACSFATPGFVIMTCGTIVFQSSIMGMKIFLLQILSGLCLLWITRGTPIYSTNLPTTTSSFMNSLKNAILESGKTLYMIGGYLMLFMSITAIIVQFLPEAVQLPIRIVAEFSSGTMLLSSLSLSTPILLLCLNMLLSFGGFCVHMQVISMAKETMLSYRSYLIYRLLQVVLVALFTLLFLYFQLF